MTVRTKEEIYNSLLDNLTNRITRLTNFTENSFNYVWTQAFSEELREREIQLTVAQLSGWVDYAGGPLSEEDLEQLDLENVTVEELNEYIEDQHLDELVKIVGVERDMGTLASGTVTFTTQSASTTIVQGTEVGTQPDSQGNFLSYVTTEGATTGSGVTTVDVPIEAEEVGEEYNAGGGTITYLPDPPSGVQAVFNADAIDGGEDVESNDEFRERAKNAVFLSSGGGTVQGMIGYIEENTGASEVTIVEFPSGDSIRDYPHGHVVVSGGTDEEVQQAIEESRPTSVEHVLRRPAIIALNVDITVEGEGIDLGEVEDDLENFLNTRSLDEDLYEDRIIFIVMRSDDDIDNIVSIDYTISDESFFFDPSLDVYRVQLGGEMVDDGLLEVTGTEDGNSYTFVDDADYQETDDSGNGDDDALDWSVGRSSTTETLSYSSGQTEYALSNDLIHGGISSVQNTTTSTALTEGTDWEHADTDGDNLQNGIRFLNPQSGGDSIDVTYDHGDLPDVLTNQSQSETFETETDRYNIDDALIQDGITEVTGTFNGSSHTFVEGTDYEEWDSNGDGRPEGIDWSIGGDSPDDDTSFTVTYDAGTQFLVNYDIREGDIELDADEKFTAGDVNITEV